MRKKSEEKKNNGITLIALIITIIVMLILAGVSLNAIVGDNGILSQATSATYATSIANLQEYLQELYVENYDAIEAGNYSNKVEGLAGQSAYKYYFYNPSRDSSVGALSYISTSDGYVLYLINKSKLPSEIQDLLVGGDAGDKTYADYAGLNDVYGVTSDLKVYYCSGGVDTITGITATELDTDNLQRVVFASTSSSAWYNLLSSYDTNSDSELTVQELRSVKTLTIDNTSGISSLAELYNLTSLQELTLDGLTLSNIDGIENAVQLYYVYFKSCVIEDYTALADVSKLEYLYFYNIDDEELETACAGIASAEFSKLTYLAIVGNTTHISSTFTSQDTNTYTSYSSKSTNTITTLAPLDTLSDTTKKAVQYLSVQNNNISGDLSYISDYTNLTLLRCEYNSLSSLYGLGDMSKLKYLCGADNSLGNGSNESDTSIASLSGNTSLYALNLAYNTNLAYVDDLAGCTAIRYLFLSGCSGDMLVANIRDIIISCGANYSLPVKFVTAAVYDVSEYWDDPSKSTYEELYEDLYGNTYITHLSLEGTTLTNEQYQEILSTMTSLTNVTLKDCESLSTIDFVGEGKVTGLYEFDLRGTIVADLTNLNDYALSLKILRLDYEECNLTEIQDCFGRLTGTGAFWNTSGWYLTITSLDLLKKLEECRDISTLYLCGAATELGDYVLDLSSLSNMVKFVENRLRVEVVLPSQIAYVMCDTSYPALMSSESDSTLIYELYNERMVTFSTDLWDDLFESFQNCKLIKTLCLDRCTLDSLELFGIYDVCVSGLCLYDASFNYKNEIDAISGIGNLSDSLTTLEIYYNSLITDFSELGNLVNLEIFKIYYTNFSDTSCLEYLTNLQTLTLNDNSIANITPLSGLTQLTTLDVRNNAIYNTYSVTNDNIQTLIDLYNNGSLRTLYLSGNGGLDTESDKYKELIGLNWSSSSEF